MEDIYELHKLIHPLSSKNGYKIDIMRCLEILKTMNTNYNEATIGYKEWEYLILQLPSNLFDYDNIDIIIRPSYETYDENYVFQNNFNGDKNNVQYVIQINNEHCEIHIFIKDFIYEIDSLVMFLLLNILFLNKNKKIDKQNYILCKDKQNNGCTVGKCGVYPEKEYNNTLAYYKQSNSKMKSTTKNKSKTKTKKITKNYELYNKHIVSACIDSKASIIKVLKYNKIPNYTISISSLNYKLSEKRFEYLSNMYASKLLNIIDVKENIDKEDIDIHIIYGYTSIIKKLLNVYDMVDKKRNKIYKDYDDIYIKTNKLINKEYTAQIQGECVINMRYDHSINCGSLIINLTELLKTIKKLKKGYIMDPVFNDIKLDSKKKIYIVSISNLFGINSYYMTKSLCNILGDKIKSINATGTCGGTRKDMEIGDIIISNEILCWENIIRDSINKSIYETMKPSMMILNNLDAHNIDINENKIKKYNDKLNSAENYKLHIGKTCTVSILPYETIELLEEYNRQKILAIDMENYWLLKGKIDGNSKAISNHINIISDVPINKKFLHEKELFVSKEKNRMDMYRLILLILFGYGL